MGDRLAARRWLAGVSGLALACGAASAATAAALPTGGKVVAGTASIGAASGLGLSVTQTSARAIIDWSSFSIGAGRTVRIDNGSGATLNRVTGGSVSSLKGLLDATGSVYLINPNGVIIGRSGVVSVGGTFVASTLDAPDSAFFTSGPLTLAGSSSAAVINYGRIGALGGDVALVAARVGNAGSIHAREGDAGLLAGYSVILSDASLDQGRFSVALGGAALGGAGARVTNSGLISAADAELRAENGNVYALAGDTRGVIRATGVKAGGGRVWLVAEGGRAEVSGVVSARGAAGAPGRVETSGEAVAVKGARIDAGVGGTWLLDPDDLTIDASLAASIAASLDGGTSVTEQTTASGTGGGGDIAVDASIAWRSDASLTLSAYRDIDFASGVVVSNSYDAGGSTSPVLTLRADNTGTGTGTVAFATGSKVAFNTSDGTVHLFYNPLDGAAQTSVNAQRYTTSVGYAGGSAGYTREVTLGTHGAQRRADMLVDSVYDLQDVQNDLSGDFALGRDIDASATASWNGGAGFTPIGSDSSASNATRFTGRLDGQGHTISGLTLDQPGADYVGLFGYIAAKASIGNVNLTGDSVTGEAYVGALVGRNAGGEVIDDSASGAVTGSGAQVGGLVGYDTGTITASSTSGTVTGANYLGGLTGYDGDGTISQSHSTAIVSGAHTVGGLVGEMYGDAGLIEESYTAGQVTGEEDVGGLLGYASHGEFVNDYNTGAVQGSSSKVVGSFGGLVGATYYSSVTSSYNAGDVSGRDSTGGVVGASDYSVVAQSYNSGNVQGRDYVGGLVGANEGDSGSNQVDVNQSYNTGLVSGKAFVGGLAGIEQFGYISQSYTSGSVAGQSNVAGLIGYAQGDTIDQCYSSGMVSKGGSGLIAGQGGATITDSYWDITTSGQTTSSSGTGLTTAQMANQSSYNGFDFANTWYLVSGMAHPILRSELSGSVIVNAHQLELIGQDAATLAGHYTLGSDISMAELDDPAGPWLTAANASIDGGAYGFLPIGTNSDATSATRFTGSLDGQGHTISGLSIYQPSATDVGLFGYVDQGGAVADLTLASASVSGQGHVGALAGYDAGALTQVAVVGGAVAGTGTGTGGLVGDQDGGAVTQALSTATVGGADSGGLVGANAGTITQSYAQGAVTGSAGVGGLVGDNTGVVRQAYSSGKVTGSSDTGGLIGTGSGVVTDAYWDPKASGQSTSDGGFAKGTGAFQSGALPAGFDPSVWGAESGQYPYLLWRYPTGP